MGSYRIVAPKRSTITYWLKSPANTAALPVEPVAAVAVVEIMFDASNTGYPSRLFGVPSRRLAQKPPPPLVSNVRILFRYLMFAVQANFDDCRHRGAGMASRSRMTCSAAVPVTVPPMPEPE